ncbi:DinB family protein [Mucilaginibacter auburnensis]|uniref:DinB family protein n=1 Tax=Mucilaginibacter auburnensis TaxID=1457233 RepID=A0A2H9VMV9_9SPHI|nr:DinB family protein [Mucilaginibacter auburnensis]PJJ79653.1 DinB family protein [Mucilaginibacter auburnensis]
MEFLLDIAKHTRLNFINLMDGLTIEQLNVIPQGFNNNIAWNFNHIVAAQQILCYVRGHVDTRIPLDKITKYQRGTSPDEFISEEELAYYKEQAFTLLETLKADVDAGIFNNYEAVTTMFGVTLNNVNDAIAYFVTHDNLHFGYALSLRRAVLAEAEQLESQNTINNN